MAVRLLGETEESKNKTKFIRPMLHSLSYDRASSIAWNEFQMFLHVPLKRRNWDICLENYSEWYSLLPAWLFGQAGGENLGCHCLNLKEVFFCFGLVFLFAVFGNRRSFHFTSNCSSNGEWENIQMAVGNTNLEIHEMEMRWLTYDNSGMNGLNLAWF